MGTKDHSKSNKEGHTDSGVPGVTVRVLWPCTVSSLPWQAFVRLDGST